MKSPALAFALVACGHPAPAPAPPPPAHAAAADPTCPIAVPGTSVTVEDTDAGAAFVFVTTSRVDDVRKSARLLADAIASHSPGGLAGMISTKSSASEADIDGGARVTLVAADPSQVGALQSELRMHAQHLSTGSCAMDMHDMKGM